MIKLVKSILLIVFITPSVLSIKCFRCNSRDDPKGCSHGFDIDRKYLQDCGNNNVHSNRVRNSVPGCWKTVIRFDANNGNPAGEKVVRDCGHVYLDKSNKCNYRGSLGFEEGDWWLECSCDSNACNSALSIAVLWHIPAIFASSTLLLII